MKSEIVTLLAAAVGTGVPVGWGRSKRNESIPRIAIYQTSGFDDYAVDAPTGLREASVQVNIYAASPGAANTLASTVRTALGGHAAGVIYGAFLVSGPTDMDAGPDIDEHVAGIRMDFDIVYRV